VTDRRYRALTGKANALAPAAGEFVRKAVEMLGVQANAIEQLTYPRLHLVALRAVELQRHAHDLPHPLARVERCVGVLEDHLHLAPEWLERALGCM
jgi:hypothetical protein